jgi:hypothetical protein
VLTIVIIHKIPARRVDQLEAPIAWRGIDWIDDALDVVLVVAAPFARLVETR